MSITSDASSSNNLDGIVNCAHKKPKNEVSRRLLEENFSRVGEGGCQISFNNYWLL
jgi:hypothetical protein